MTDEPPLPRPDQLLGAAYFLTGVLLGLLVLAAVALDRERRRRSPDAIYVAVLERRLRELAKAESRKERTSEPDEVENEATGAPLAASEDPPKGEAPGRSAPPPPAPPPARPKPNPDRPRRDP